MKDERVPPHGNSDCIIPKGQAKGADKETLAAREEPDGQDHEQVDKVAQVGQEVVVANLVVCVPPNGHEIA